MMKLKPEAALWDPIPGVPWRDMSDAEFADVSAAYDAQFSAEQRGSLSRWFDHVPDVAAAPATDASTTTTGDAGKGA